MVITALANPHSLIKAAMLARLHKCPAVHRADLANSLWQANEVVDADAVSWQEAYDTYQRAFGPVDWLENHRLGKNLAAVIYYGARFKARDRYGLVFQVLDQALAYGAEYVLAKISPEAKTLVTRARRVTMELHRAYGFIRFNPDSTGILTGFVRLEHDTADLILAYFARRYRSERKIVLLANNREYIWEDGKITVREAVNVHPAGEKDDFDALWDAYYDSQVIEGRINKKRARKHLPRKLWSWVPEGKKLN